MRLVPTIAARNALFSVLICWFVRGKIDAGMEAEMHEDCLGAWRCVIEASSILGPWILRNRQTMKSLMPTIFFLIPMIDIDRVSSI